MNKLSDQSHGTLLALTGITAVSPEALLVRLIGSGTLIVVFWRGLLSALVLLTWIMAKRGSGTLAAFRAIGWIGLIAASLYVVTALLFIEALRQTAVANVLVIVGAQPIVAALLSALLLRERIARSTLIAALVVGVGLAIVFHGALGRGSIVGDLMAFGAMLCVALRYVLFRLARHVDMLPSVVLGGLLTALVIAPFCDPFDIPARDMLLLLMLGLVLMPIAQILLTAAPRFIPVPEIALIVLLEAVLAPTWVWLVLGEVPPEKTIYGGVLIIGTLMAHFTLMTRRQGTVPTGCR